MNVDYKSTQLERRERWYTRLINLFTEPHASIVDVGERRRARLLSAITLIFSVALLWGGLSNPTSYGTFVILLVTTLLSYTLSRGKYYRVGTYFFSYGITLVTYLTLYLGTATTFTAAISSTAHVSLIVASVLLSLRGFVILVILSAAATFGAPLYSQTPIVSTVEYFRTAGVFTSIGLILTGALIFRSRIERDRLQEVNNINRELESITNNLEDRVKERTTELDRVNRLTTRRAAQLEAISELSQSIAQVRNPNELFQVAVQLISERFGFYHVGIFLLDHDQEFAVLHAANSEGGQKMLERGHRLMLGTGVVGFAAQTGKPRIALDVGTDAVFFNNPDLPATRSEVALPLRSGDRTIGVLDVQSTEPGAFSEEDLQVLTALASQVAIALENARLLSDARASALQVQEVYNEFVRTEWSRTTKNMDQAGFRYNSGRIELLELPMEGTDIESAVQFGKAAIAQEDGTETSRSIVSVPVKLRDEVIGILRVESKDGSHKWHDEELSLIEAVAERAALAMENARLFQDARRRAAKEKLISEATSRISGSLNIENILQATASELERVLGGSEVFIQFGSRDSS
ncbi:MAG TPA: GAF domain-containing protein [Anaerolineales bacterium]|nr:GAF domain-containing protein [Anaerolineales bacterium]